MSDACKGSELHHEVSYSTNELVKFFNVLNICLSDGEPVQVVIRNTNPKPKVKAKAKLEIAAIAGVHLANYYFSDNIFGNSNEGMFSRAILRGQFLNILLVQALPKRK